MKRFSLTAAILILMTAIFALAAPKPSSANVPAFPGTLANARYVTLLPMTEISSIETYFPKIGRRSALCRTPFRSGAS